MKQGTQTIGQKLLAVAVLLPMLLCVFGGTVLTQSAGAVSQTSTKTSSALPIAGLVGSDYKGFALQGINWVYLSNGKAVDGNGRLYSGTILGQKGLYVVRNGKVDFTFTGLAWNKSGTYYCERGKAVQSGPATRTIDNELMSFDKDGKCTSARGMAVKILYQTGFDLEKAFIWTAKNIRYNDNAPHMYDAALTTAEYAEHGFKTRGGSCYVYASCFYEFARVLGYDARNVVGVVVHKDGRRTQHGWVEIKQNGKTYFCDPEYQYETYHRKGTNFHFMKEYGSAGSLNYEPQRTLA